MKRSGRERSQDQQFEGSLRQIESFVAHLHPLHFYTSNSDTSRVEAQGEQRLASQLLEAVQIGLQRFQRWHTFSLVLDDVPLDPADRLAGGHDRRPVKFVGAEVGIRILFRKW